MEFILRFSEDRYLNSVLKGSLHFGKATTFHPDSESDAGELGPNILDESEGISTINYGLDDVEVSIQSNEMRTPFVIDGVTKLEEKISFVQKNVGTISLTVLDTRDFEKNSQNDLVIKKSVIEDLSSEFPNRPLVIETFEEFIHPFQKTILIAERDASIKWMQAGRVKYKRDGEFDPLVPIEKRDYIHTAFFEKPYSYHKQREFRIAAEFIDEIGAEGRNYQFDDLFLHGNTLPSAEALQVIRVRI